MISLTITDMNTMTRQDAAALRAIADAYHPQTKSTAFPALNDVHVPGKIETAQVSSLASVGDFPPGTQMTSSSDAFRDAVRTHLGHLSDAKIKVDDLSSITANIGPRADLADQFLASVQGTAQRMGVTATLHPHDNPAVGAPDQHALADHVFSGGVVIPTNENAEPDPAVVFGGGAQLFGVSFVTTQPDGASVFAPGEVRDLPNVGAVGAMVTTPAALNTAGEVPNVPATQIVGAATAPGGTPAIPPSAIIAGASAMTPTPPPPSTATAQILPPPSGAALIASPPPPPPPAPAPDSASAGVVTTNGVQVDKAGLPWDARIHASTKTMTAKGVWTRRRGVEDSVVEQVEQQLRTAMSISAPPAPAAGSAWPFPTDSSSVTGNAPPPASDAATFPSMMQFITERIGAGVLTQDQVQTAVRTTGLESLNLVMARPDLIPAIMTELRKVAP